MITSVTRHDFINAFDAIRPDNFNYAGLCALFYYLEQYEEDAGEQVELDVIALCCDFCQYDSAEEAWLTYHLDNREALEDNTIVIDCNDGSVIIQNF